MTSGSSSRRRPYHALATCYLLTTHYSLLTTYYLLLATRHLLRSTSTTLCTTYHYLPLRTTTYPLQAANPGELNEWDDDLDDFTSEVS